MPAHRSPRFSRLFSLAFATASLAFSGAAWMLPGCSKATSIEPSDSCPDTAGGMMCSPGTCANPGGPSPGPADAHCGGAAQPVVQAACHWDGGGPDPGLVALSGSGGGGAGSGGAGGGAAAGAGGGSRANGDYGPTQYGFEGDDDDCKFHLVWSSTPICENAGVTFTVKLTNKVTNEPATGDQPFVDVFKSSVHAAPNGPCACKASTSTEEMPGVYTIGPVFFDQPGMWTVRFHFNHDCTDFSDESPHGHAAYYIDVP